MVAMRHKGLLWWLAVAVLVARGLSAGTIEVSPNGDDAGRGTAERPLKTIRKAVSMAKPGDTIAIRAGTYREGPIVVARGGTAQAPLIIQGAKDAVVMIKGSKIVTGWQATPEGRWKASDWPINSQQLFVDGKPLQQIGVQSPWHTTKAGDGPRMCLPPVGEDLNDVSPGCFYYETATKSLYCTLRDRSSPNEHEMEASVADFVLDGEDASFVTLRNLTFMHNNGTAKGACSSLVRTSGSGWTVEDCTFAYGDFAGLGLSGEKHVVRRSEFLNNGDQGLSVNGSDAAHKYKWYRERPPQNILLEDLVVKGNNYRRFYEHWEAGGMKLIPAVHAVTVRRCQVEENWGPGIWLDGALGDNVIEDNFVRNNRTGIFYEISLPVEGDRFGASIRNNRVIGSQHQGIYISASSGAIVQNNTCFRNGWDIVVHGMPRNDLGFDLQLKDNVVKDNIVCGCHADVIVFVGDNASNNVVDGNFYADLGDDRGEPKADHRGVAFGAVKDSGYDAAHRDLGDVFSRCGFEAHGTSGDPRWKGTAAGDFGLEADSPAKGKGWQSR